MDLLDILPPAHSAADVSEQGHCQLVPGLQPVSGALGLEITNRLEGEKLCIGTQGAPNFTL